MRIVNKRTHQPSTQDVYIGRPSPLGNRFVIGKDGRRDEVIAKYTIWLRQQVRTNNPAVMRALRGLHEQSVLVCWCSPRPCHGEVIVEAWQALRQAGRV